MKLLIVSDSHGDWRILQTLVEKENPDAVLHLGDHIGDAQKLSILCPHIPVEAVSGNCDGFFPKDGTDLVLSYEGVRFFLTHGHAYGVKSGLHHLSFAGRNAQVDAILFGHTHQACVDKTKDGVWMVNPGTAGGVHAPASYVLAHVKQGKVNFELKWME